MEELFPSPDLIDFPLNLHQAMLEDRTRVRAFGRALAEVVEPGDVVVDVGTGTGILAFLALQRGARKVLAIDKSGIVHTARRVRDLNFPGAPVSFRKLDVRHDALPKLKADVLVCELIGNLGIEEGIVESIVTARDHFLKPGGHMIPARLSLQICPVTSSAVHRELSAWQRPFMGIDFSPFQELAYANVYHLPNESVTLLGRPESLVELDFETLRAPQRRMGAQMTVTRRGVMHGIGGWFDATLSPKVEVSSDPRSAETHWGQVFYPIGPPEPVGRGTTVDFELRVRASDDEIRVHWQGHIRHPRGSGRRRRSFGYSARTPR